MAKILIVDDARSNRVLLGRIFKDIYEIEEADNGVTAIEIMKSNDIAAVLLDISMPELDGFGVLEKMRRSPSLSDIPVIVITAYDDADSHVKVLDLGAVDIIGKPFNPCIVLARVRNTIESRTARKIAAEANLLKQQIKHQEETIRLAQHDRLTGLYNRDAFCEKAAEMISEKPEKYYVISCFDIDNFKVINDQYGIEIGDLVLKLTSGIFDQFAMRSNGIASHMSADNFAILYATGSVLNIQKFLSVITSSLEKRGIHATIQFSAGRYVVDDKTLTVSAMIDRALIAKRSVKGRYDLHMAYYNEAMRESILEEQWIISQMEDALKNNCFETWFQPQYNHSTGAMVGAEALVRWRNKERGIISPGIFIPIFERNGFIFLLDKYIWRQTCLYLRKWLDEGKNPVPVSVNVSRYDMFRVGFVETITDMIEEFDIPKNLFRLEITESAFAKSTEQIVEIVKKLRDFGLIVEIDDFGSGYSSFNTLKDVPSDILKIDMRFLESSTNSVRGGNILESIVRMARWLNMDVIAEGVEVKEQADYLCSVGCTTIQGYLYSKPVTSDDFEILLNEGKKEFPENDFETTDKMDPDSFWSPSSLETLVFNRYSGGAFVFEYRDGNIDILRVNEKLASVFKTTLNFDEIVKYNPLRLYSKKQRNIIQKTIELAIEQKEAEIAELKHFVHGKPEYVRFTIRMLARSKGSYLFYCYVENVTAQHVAEKANTELINQLVFLNDTSRDLIIHNKPSTAMQNMLDKILEFFGGSRAYISEPNFIHTTISNTYERCANGVSSEINNLQNMPISVIDAWMKQFDEKGYINISNVEKLDEGRFSEREILEVQGIKSLIAVPLYRGEMFVGLLGIDNPKKRLSHVEHLMAVADYMAILLGRRDLSERVASISSLMDDIPSALAMLYVISEEKIKVVFASGKSIEFFGMTSNEFIKKFSENALAAVHPDDEIKVRKELDALSPKDKASTINVRLVNGNGCKELCLHVHANISPENKKYVNIWYSPDDAEV